MHEESLMKETRHNKKIKAAHLPEVDALLEEASGISPESVSFARAESSTTTVSRAPKKTRPEKKRGRGWGIAFVCLLAIALIGAAIIAEPWVPAVKDSYTLPAIKELPKRTLAVNENYLFEITLADNEQIKSVEIADPDILALSENNASVTAKGAYFRTTLNITTSEIALPEYSYPHTVVLFGKDYSEPYDNLRGWLRELIGVETRLQARTELRVLARYTQTLTVTGMDAVTAPSPTDIAAFLQNGVTLEVPVDAGDDIMLASSNETTATVTLNKIENGTALFTVAGVADTKTKVTATVGFWKKVSPTVYADYLTASGLEAGADNLRENEIFVPCRAQVFGIAVTDLDKPVVTTDLAETTERVYPDDGHHSATGRALLELVNKLRTDNGLAALTWNDSLYNDASARAVELAAAYGHKLPDGAKAECIAAGYLTAQEVFDCWNACESGRAAMLSADATSFGGDYYRNSDRVYSNYWCGLFG